MCLILRDSVNERSHVMRSKFSSFKASCCMVIALSALVLLGGVFSPANAADGIITTVAGSGVPDANGWIQGGFSGDGGPSTSAQLNIAIDLLK